MVWGRCGKWEKERKGRKKRRGMKKGREGKREEGGRGSLSQGREVSCSGLVMGEKEHHS